MAADASMPLSAARAIVRAIAQSLRECGLSAAPSLATSRGIERFGRLRGYLYFFGLGESLLRKTLFTLRRTNA
jgi:hypothetical protein